MGRTIPRDLSDVDLTDPDDVKATVTDPQGAVLVHLGSSNFLERFKVYVCARAGVAHAVPPLKSVDLRYRAPGDCQSRFAPRAAAPPAAARTPARRTPMRLR